MFFGGNPIVGRHLTARAAEVAGFDAPHECDNFVKPLKPRGLERNSGPLLPYYTLGSDPALWPAGERRERE